MGQGSQNYRITVSYFPILCQDHEVLHVSLTDNTDLIATRHYRFCFHKALWDKVLQSLFQLSSRSKLSPPRSAVEGSNIRKGLCPSASLNAVFSKVWSAANGNNFNILDEVAKQKDISGLAEPLSLLCSTSYQVWKPSYQREVMGCYKAWLFLLGCCSVQILPILVKEQGKNPGQLRLRALPGYVSAPWSSQRYLSHWYAGKALVF